MKLHLEIFQWSSHTKRVPPAICQLWTNPIGTRSKAHTVNEQLWISICLIWKDWFSIIIDTTSNRSLAQTIGSSSHITEHTHCHVDSGDTDCSQVKCTNDFTQQHHCVFTCLLSYLWPSFSHKQVTVTKWTAVTGSKIRSIKSSEILEPESFCSGCRELTCIYWHSWLYLCGAHEPPLFSTKQQQKTACCFRQASKFSHDKTRWSTFNTGRVCVKEYKRPAITAIKYMTQWQQSNNKAEVQIICSFNVIHVITLIILGLIKPLV